MTRADLLALAERAEQAEGADRELDVEIHLLIGRPVGTQVDDDGCEYQALASIPEYSASLDAALSLVPDGQDWCLSQGDREQAIASMSPTNSFADVCVTAATPALALVAAALRARAEEAKDGE